MLNVPEITEHVLHERLELIAGVCAVTRNYHLAEDVYQEIFVKAVALTDKFTSKSHLTNWFRLSARNRAIDLIRTREGRYVGLSEEALLAIEDSWGSVEVARRESQLAALEKCVETLTPRSRQIVKLRYFENRSGQEIAEFMGRKVGSAYQAIARIHKSLTDCMKQRLEVGGT
jgi:RNA polymerase sigma-70 factor, ECF subfamily